MWFLFKNSCIFIHSQIIFNFNSFKFIKWISYNIFQNLLFFSFMDPKATYLIIQILLSRVDIIPVLNIILIISKKYTLVKYMIVEIYIFLKHWTFYETIKLCVWLIKSVNLIYDRSRNVNIRVKNRLSCL